MSTTIDQAFIKQPKCSVLPMSSYLKPIRLVSLWRPWVISARYGRLVYLFLEYYVYKRSEEKRGNALQDVIFWNAHKRTKSS